MAIIQCKVIPAKDRSYSLWKLFSLVAVVNVCSFVFISWKQLHSWLFVCKQHRSHDEHRLSLALFVMKFLSEHVFFNCWDFGCNTNFKKRQKRNEHIIACMTLTLAWLDAGLATKCTPHGTVANRTYCLLWNH